MAAPSFEAIASGPLPFATKARAPPRSASLRSVGSRSLASKASLAKRRPRTAEAARSAAATLRRGTRVAAPLPPDPFDPSASNFGRFNSHYPRPLREYFRRPRIAGQQKRAKFPTSKAHISAVFHSFRLIFGRAIISRSGAPPRRCPEAQRTPAPRRPVRRFFEGRAAPRAARVERRPRAPHAGKVQGKFERLSTYGLMSEDPRPMKTQLDLLRGDPRGHRPPSRERRTPGADARDHDRRRRRVPWDDRHHNTYSRCNHVFHEIHREFFGSASRLERVPIHEWRGPSRR
ncbi:hypothetical protein JL722_8876 [Aureococcus anophagefferens]|nr:hypothetical protein JL722_8876 [Aureococcus anophagefferens]